MVKYGILSGRMQQVVDFTKLLQGYRDRWVALSPDKDKVVAAEDSPAATLAEAKRKGYKGVTILWAAEDYSGSIPGL